MMLVSFKNIHIWPSYGQVMARMPIVGHKFFGYNSAIFEPIRTKFLREFRRLLSIDW